MQQIFILKLEQWYMSEVSIAHALISLGFDLTSHLSNQVTYFILMVGLGPSCQQLLHNVRVTILGCTYESSPAGLWEVKVKGKYMLNWFGLWQYLVPMIVK